MTRTLFASLVLLGALLAATSGARADEKREPLRIAVVPAIPPAAGGDLIPEQLSAGVADILGHALCQIGGVVVSNPSAVYQAALASGGQGGTTPAAVALAARRVQAEMAILVDARREGEKDVVITGTPAAPDNTRGKTPAPFTRKATCTLGTDFFNLQDSFVKAAIEALGLKPTPDEQARIDLVVRSTASPQAFELYSEACRYLPKASLEAYDKAIKALRQITVGAGAGQPAVDAQFALAQAALARAASLGSMQQWLVGLRDLQMRTLALKAGEDAVKARPELPESHRALAVASALVKRIQPAAEAARKALAIRPGDPEALLWLGVAYGGDGATQINAALALDPALGLGHLFLAVLAAADGDTKRMLAECEKALELNPVDASPLLLVGMVQTGEGNSDAAIATYQRVLKINRRAALAHGALARLYYRKGQMGLAQDSLRQAFALDFRVSELMREQAAAYQQAGKTDDAEKEYRLILLGDEKDTPSLRGLGMLALDRGKLDEAEKWFRQALANSPKDAWSFIGLSRCHQRQRKSEEALQDLRRAAEIKPDDGFVQLELGQAYEQRGRTREAVDAYDKAIEAMHLPEAYFRKAQILDKTEPARAREAWKGFVDAITAVGGPMTESDRVRVDMARQRLQ